MKLKNFKKLLNIKMGIFSKFNTLTLLVLLILMAISALYINEKRIAYNKLSKQSHFIKKLVLNNELKALVHDEFTLSVKYLDSDSTEEELEVAQQKVDLNIRRLNVLQDNFITSENHKLIKKWRDQVKTKDIRNSELNDQFKSFEILLSKKHSDIIYSNDMPLSLLHDQVILTKAFDSTLQLNSSFNQENNESISSSHLSAYYTLWSIANDDILIDTTSFQEEMTKLKEYFSHTTYDKYLYSSKGIGFDVYTQLLSSMLMKHLEKVRTLVHVQKTNNLFQIQLVSVLLIMFLMVAIFSLISLRKVSKHFRLKFHDINNFMTIINLISASLTKSSNNTKESNQIQKDNVQFMLGKINEVKGTIKENTDIAKETKDAVSESIVIVGEGKESVELMDKHFNEMGDSSNDLIAVLDEVKEEFSKIQAVIEEISQKTSIINDIVFQTKLLSFNASVEAARAGEHGKGFAVVAEEIGNLAKMSGVASEEISTLTTNSSQLVERIIENMSMKVNDYVVDSKERIERNTSNVKKCVDIFQQIYLTSHNISNKVIDFTMITEEQSEGVREIANCVDGIVEVTEKTFDASLKNLELISRTGNSVNKVMKVLEGLSIIVRGSLIDVHQIKDEKLKSIILSTKKNKSIDDELLELTEKSEEVA